jgi:SPP1 family predicted phage head-tail adaptor
MDYSLMRNRLTILKRPETQDSEGYPIPGDQQVYGEVFKTAAAIFTTQGREFFAAASVQAEDTLRFVFRYPRSIEITSDMLVRHNGIVYEIVAPPINDNMAFITMTLVCRGLSRG